MAEEEIKLLGVWASPFNQRVEAVLKLKGLKYEFVQEDLSNKSDLLLQSNPIYKKIPVLIHNGNPVVESLVIMEYIDQTWGNDYPILPDDPYDRAIARFWAKFFDDKVVPAVWKAILVKDKEKEEAAIEEFSQQLKMLEGELIKEKKDYFGGEKIGFVDIAAFFVLNLVGVMQEAKGAEQEPMITEDKFPVVFKWMEKVGDKNNVVGQVVPPRDKHVEFIRGRIAVAAAAAAAGSA